MFKSFVSTLHDSYTPSESITINKQLVTFRDRFLFKQNIPSKPDKYSINCGLVMKVQQIMY